MKEILIINLTRMGDLLQTTPLMSGLRSAFADSRITLVANAPFAEICKGMPFIDELLLFDIKGFRARLVEGKHSLVANYRFLEEFVDRINGRRYDLAINVTHSPVSALITSLVNASEVRGFTVDSEGHRVIKHPWMRYFFNVIPNRQYNSFHLVDMYLKTGEVPPVCQNLLYHIPEGSEERASRLMSGDGVQEDGMLIGIHLGASKDDKAWPVESYAELAGMIEDRLQAKLLLFGTTGETELASRFQTLSRSRAVNYVGRTNIGELASLLRRCRLLISNDTGPLHIATAVGTQVVDISNANVHFMETGPYGRGHFVIQADLPCVPCGFDVRCPEMVCKSVITPRAVFEVVRAALERQDLCAGAEDPCWNSLQVYRSCFREDGFLWFTPLIRRRLTEEALYRIVYRYVWSGDIAWPEDTAQRIGDDIGRELSASYRTEESLRLHRTLQKDIGALEELKNFAGEADVLIQRMEAVSTADAMNVGELKKLYEKLLDVDERMEMTGHAHAGIRPITLICRYTREAMEGNDLPSLVPQARAMYHDLAVRAGNMQEALRRITSISGRTQETGPARCLPSHA